MPGEAAWTLVYFCVLTIWAWAPVAGLFGAHRLRWVQAVRHEAHPFIPILTLINLALDTWGVSPVSSWLNYLSAAWVLVSWVTAPDDDDRWKRRRKKLSARIARRGARLAIVSGGSS